MSKSKVLHLAQAVDSRAARATLPGISRALHDVSPAHHSRHIQPLAPDVQLCGCRRPFSQSRAPLFGRLPSMQCCTKTAACLMLIGRRLASLNAFKKLLARKRAMRAKSSCLQETHNSSWLVRQYYRHRILMGFCCVCCEVLYLSLYMVGWQSRTEGSVLGASSEKPGGGQWTFFVALAVGSFPGFVIKQFVNFAQIRAAMSALMILDLERDRKEKRASRKS